MAKREYQIKFCWNGSKKQVAFTDEFETKSEWEFVIDGLPYDLLDGNDHIVWVDYGDNDDWEG